MGRKREFYIGFNVSMDDDDFTENYDDLEKFAEDMRSVVHANLELLGVREVDLDTYYDKDIEP